MPRWRIPSGTRRFGRESTRRSLHGIWGYVDDVLRPIQPWGFDVTQIRVPTRVLYGLTDVLVPRQHGDWLADNVPGAEAVIDEQGGHGVPIPSS